jgi:hypothetical protein
VDDVAIAMTGAPARPLILARMSDATLDATSYDTCYAQFPVLTRITPDAWTHLRPALVATANGADAVFRGAFDPKLYWSHFDGNSWGSIATDGNLNSDQIPIAIYEGNALHAVFNNVKDNGNIYDGTIQSAGGTATILGGNTNFAPVAVTVANETYVVFTGKDTWLYFYELSDPGTVKRICSDQGPSCFILSSMAPTVTAGSDGSVVAIWIGKDDAHVYSSSLAPGASVWSGAQPVSGNAVGETTALAVAASPGIATAIVEAVYVHQGDGYPRHARLVGGAWHVSTIAPVALTGAVALAVSP